MIEQFYDAFKDGDAQKMASCYHPDARFSDPAFQNLNSEETKAMWSMLLERSKGNLEISYHSIQKEADVESCVWEAKYPFSQTGRLVHNVIATKMKLKDGLIVDHTDTFDLWKWAGMAIGPMGKLLGWTPMLQNRIRMMAMTSLEKYMSKS